MICPNCGALDAIDWREPREPRGELIEPAALASAKPSAEPGSAKPAALPAALSDTEATPANPTAEGVREPAPVREPVRPDA